jgi:hypothetical protein
VTQSLLNLGGRSRKSPCPLIKIAYKIDFSIVNLVSDNYWSKCTGANGPSLVELTFLMCGDIEH